MMDPPFQDSSIVEEDTSETLFMSYDDDVDPPTSSSQGEDASTAPSSNSVVSPCDTTDEGSRSRIRFLQRVGVSGAATSRGTGSKRYYGRQSMGQLSDGDCRRSSLQAYESCVLGRNSVGSEPMRPSINESTTHHQSLIIGLRSLSAIQHNDNNNNNPIMLGRCESTMPIEAKRTCSATDSSTVGTPCSRRGDTLTSSTRSSTATSRSLDDTSAKCRRTTPPPNTTRNNSASDDKDTTCTLGDGSQRVRTGTYEGSHDGESGGGGEYSSTLSLTSLRCASLNRVGLSASSEDEQSSPIEKQVFGELENRTFSSRSSVHKSSNPDGDPRNNKGGGAGFSEFRLNYLKRLSYANVWVPQNRRPPKHQTLTIFDWDDTLLPTTFIHATEHDLASQSRNAWGAQEGRRTLQDTPKNPPGGPATGTSNSTSAGSTGGGSVASGSPSRANTPTASGTRNLMTTPWAEKLKLVETNAVKLVDLARSMGRVVIITNAMAEWVAQSASTYMPSMLPILKGIHVISARQHFEELFPGDYRLWKMHAFLELQKSMSNSVVMNLISAGDSSIDMDAVNAMGKEFSQCLVKKIKFQENPTPDELAKELELVREKFVEICMSARNLKISLEKKQGSPHSALVETLTPGLSCGSKVLSKAHFDSAITPPRLPSIGSNRGR